MASPDLPTMVSIAGAAVDGHVLRELRERGLTGLRPRHGYVVQRLLDGPATASAIARDLGVSPHTVATSVRELEGLGYLVRVDAPDRRGRPVALSERGRDAVRATRAARERLDSRLRDAVGGGPAEHAVDAVRALLRLLDADAAVDERRVRPPDDRS